jgi:hypothetical protein
MENSLLKNCRDVKKLNLLSSKRLCRNTRNHLDVMLSASEASVFPTPYEKQILRLWLRMTLRHSLEGEEIRIWHRSQSDLPCAKMESEMSA